MEYTREQIQRFKEEFGVRRRRQRIFTGTLFLVVIGMAFGRVLLVPFGLSEMVLFPLFIVFIIAAVGFALWNWRCPACSSSFGKLWNPRFCPNCGAPLRD